jgi:hypothetical protein
MAELTQVEKSAISHRGHALRQIAAFLRDVLQANLSATWDSRAPS